MSKYDKNKGTGLSSLTGVLAKSKEMAGENPKLDIPLAKLVAHPKNEKIYKVEKVELLAKSIEEHGFLGAIDVYKKGDTYVIISGHRRTEAMRLLGRETIPALVRPQPANEYEETMLLIQANRNIREKSPIETAREIQEWMDALKQKHGIEGNSRVRNVNVGDETAETFGLSRRQVYNYIKLLTLIPDLQELTDKEAIPWKAILEAASLPEEVQVEIAEELKERLTLLNGNDEDIPKALNIDVVRNVVDKKKQAHLKAQEPLEAQVEYKEEESLPYKSYVPNETVVEEKNETYEEPSDDDNEERRNEEQRERDYQSTISNPEFLKTYNQLMNDPFGHVDNERPTKIVFKIDGVISKAAELISLYEQKEIGEEIIEDKEVVKEAIAKLKSIISKIEKVL